MCFYLDSIRRSEYRRMFIADANINRIDFVRLLVINALDVQIEKEIFGNFYVCRNRSVLSGMTSEEIELTEMTIETLTTVVQHPHSHRYKKHILAFTTQILEKFGKILDIERNSQDPNKVTNLLRTDQLNERIDFFQDIVSNIYGLIVTTADSHSKTFIDTFKSANVEEQNISIKLFETILGCTDLPGSYPTDETNSIVTFAFWYTLQVNSSPKCFYYLK